VITFEAQERRQRAAVAHRIMALYRADELDEPESWTWSRLSTLPQWCLLTEQERLKIQHTCGAIAYAPQLADCISGQHLQAAVDCCGESTIEQLVDEVLAFESTRSESGTGMIELDSTQLSNALNEISADEVGPLLQKTGASVLVASLDPSLPVDRLSKDLGEQLGSFEPDMAKVILFRAHALMDESSQDRVNV